MTKMIPESWPPSRNINILYAYEHFIKWGSQGPALLITHFAKLFCELLLRYFIRGLLHDNFSYKHIVVYEETTSIHHNIQFSKMELLVFGVTIDAYNDNKNFWQIISKKAIRKYKKAKVVNITFFSTTGIEFQTRLSLAVS
jgi:hypothetical protein